jgi:hypothetical protein
MPLSTQAKGASIGLVEGVGAFYGEVCWQVKFARKDTNGQISSSLKSIQ